LFVSHITVTACNITGEFDTLTGWAYLELGRNIRIAPEDITSIPHTLPNI